VYVAIPISLLIHSCIGRYRRYFMGIDFMNSKSLEKMPNANEIVFRGQKTKGSAGSELYSSVGTAGNLI